MDAFVCCFRRVILVIYQDVLTKKNKSVRGCIVDANLSVLALVIMRKGEKDISGLCDTTIPRRLGPIRASPIRKLFNLNKKDDVRQYLVKRQLPSKNNVSTLIKFNV